MATGRTLSGSGKSDPSTTYAQAAAPSRSVRVTIPRASLLRQSMLHFEDKRRCAIGCVYHVYF